MDPRRAVKESTSGRITSSRLSSLLCPHPPQADLRPIQGAQTGCISITCVLCGTVHAQVSWQDLSWQHRLSVSSQPTQLTISTSHFTQSALCLRRLTARGTRNIKYSRGPSTRLYRERRRCDHSYRLLLIDNGPVATRPKNETLYRRDAFGVGSTTGRPFGHLQPLGHNRALGCRQVQSWEVSTRRTRPDLYRGRRRESHPHL